MPLAALPILLKALKILALVLFLLVALAGSFLWWAASGESGEESAEGWRELPWETFEGPAPPAPPADDRLVVLSWNMAYGRGPVDDAGDLRDRATVERYLEGIADAIERSGAKIVALQEVDFDAGRTHGIDQVAFLMERLGWTVAARTTTWRNNYVPYPYWPPSQHYGHMHSGQAVLSAYPIVANGRWRHPQPEGNPFFYNWFYLHRASQVVDIEIGPRVLRVVNTHLEAFDRPNRERQAEELAALVRERHCPELLVVGDFNTPSAASTRKTGFEDEPEMDFRDEPTIATVAAAVRADGSGGEVVATTWAAGGSEEATFTFPADAPTRQLDHFFFGSAFRLIEGGAWPEAGVHSDHVPIRAVLEW